MPSAVLQRVQTEMQAIRTAIFKLLEPLLKCKLGKNLSAYVLRMVGPPPPPRGVKPHNPDVARTILYQLRSFHLKESLLPV